MVDDYVSKRNNGNNVQTRSDEVLGGETPGHKLAGLHCKEKYGGPEDEYAENEMAFWSDIPSDAAYKSPFMDTDTEKFLTFQP